MPESITQIKFPQSPTTNARWPSGDKECVAWYHVIAFDRNAAPSRPDNGFHVPITVKCWMGKSRTASVVYACIWVDGDKLYWSGKGQAGGWGYDKQSAAIDGAIQNAGIDLGYHFGGSGSSAVKTALEKMASALGYTTFFVLGG